jgi:hypothetical protein
MAPSAIVSQSKPLDSQPRPLTLAPTRSTTMNGDPVWGHEIGTRAVSAGRRPQQSMA